MSVTLTICATLSGALLAISNGFLNLSFLAAAICYSAGGAILLLGVLGLALLADWKDDLAETRQDDLRDAPIF